MIRSVTRSSQALAPRSVSLERQIARRADTQALPSYLEREEVHRIADLARCRRDRMLVLTLWGTGGRVSEVLALRRQDFDREGRTLRLPNLKQGHAATKVIYCTPAFAYELLGYCEQMGLKAGDYLFPGRDGLHPLCRKSAWEIVSGLARLAGIKKDGRKSASPHNARHGAAIRMLRDGVPTKIVQDQLGHASILTTTGFYNQFTAQDKADFMSKVAF